MDTPRTPGSFHVKLRTVTTPQHYKLVGSNICKPIIYSPNTLQEKVHLCNEEIYLREHFKSKLFFG